MNKRKVALVLPVLPHYRIDFLSALHKSLLEEGSELVVISGTNAGKKQVKESKATDFRLIKNNTVGFRFIKMEINWQLGLMRSILKLRPDKVVVLYHAGKINHNLMLLLLQLMRVPYILWGSGSGDRRKDFSKTQRKLKALFKFLFIRNSHAYLCYGTQFANELKEQGYKPEAIFVAQNTLNVEAVYDNNDFHEIRGNDKPINFLFVGVIFPGKRLDAAIKVAKNLKEKGLGFKFYIVGSGAELENLRNQVESLGLENEISMPGAQYGKDLQKYFNQADVFLLPGTGGLAVNEAMAYSLPVITTPGDSTAYDLIEEGKNGFILDFEYKLDELEEKMKFFIKSDPAILKRMGERSLKIVKNKASMANMVVQFRKALNHN